MLASFGLEPGRLFSLTVRQLNALCDYMSRETRKRMEYGLSEEMKYK